MPVEDPLIEVLVSKLTVSANSSIEMMQTCERLCADKCVFVRTCVCASACNHTLHILHRFLD